jgi:hypothetical protein
VLLGAHRRLNKAIRFAGGAQDQQAGAEAEEASSDEHDSEEIRGTAHEACHDGESSRPHGWRESEQHLTAKTDGFGAWKHPPGDLDSGKLSAFLTACSIMAIYHRTLSPSITGGDSGEVMAAACSWGPAHPPGYPLFIALAQAAMWAFARLGDNPAYRVNPQPSMSYASTYNL